MLTLLMTNVCLWHTGQGTIQYHSVISTLTWEPLSAKQDLHLLSNSVLLSIFMKLGHVPCLSKRIDQSKQITATTNHCIATSLQANDNLAEYIASAKQLFSSTASTRYHAY